MNILYEYVLFCEVAIHHEHAAIILSLSLSLCPSHSLAASLRCWEPSLHNLMSLIRLYRGGMDGWMDRWREGWMGRVEKKIFYHTDSLPLSLIGALIRHTPALNGDAGKRNTAKANSDHDSCSNQSTGLMLI